MSAKQFCYPYPRPAVTVDIVIVTREVKRRVLLIRRKNEPFAQCWALPGGFVEMDESLDDAARRELYEETNVRAGTLVQLHTFGDPKRDPRGRTISVAYLAELKVGVVPARAGDDADEVGWFSLQRPPALAFDHREILRHAREYLRKSTDE